MIEELEEFTENMFGLCNYFVCVSAIGQNRFFIYNNFLGLLKNHFGDCITITEKIIDTPIQKVYIKIKGFNIQDIINLIPINETHHTDEIIDILLTEKDIEPYLCIHWSKLPGFFIKDPS